MWVGQRLLPVRGPRIGLSFADTLASFAAWVPQAAARRRMPDTALRPCFS
jgi:hypothetical protein